MKILILLLFSFLCLIPRNSIAINASTKYARATESINLYKSCNAGMLNDVICLVEKSYFVEIISEIEDNYRVEYNGIIGYVKKNDVKEITSTPFTPYPSNIKLVLSSDCNFRSSPTTKVSSTNIISTLKAGQSDFEFIGRIFSDEAIDFGGTTWYYVKYNGDYGYIYNKYIKSISPIYENTEQVNYLNDSPENMINPITNTPSLIIIIIMFIPCIIILLILYLPRKSKPRKTRNHIKKVPEKY